MRKHIIYFPIYFIQFIYYLTFYFVIWLFVRKPWKTCYKSVFFILAICPTDCNRLFPIKIINFSIFCKYYIRKFRFIIYLSTTPDLCSVSLYMIRSFLMISMNTQEIIWKIRKYFFVLPIFISSKIIQSDISQ